MRMVAGQPLVDFVGLLRYVPNAVKVAGHLGTMERGREGVSMRALADALGTAPMSLYRHVRGKDDLLRAVIELVLEVGVGSPYFFHVRMALFRVPQGPGNRSRALLIFDEVVQRSRMHGFESDGLVVVPGKDDDWRVTVIIDPRVVDRLILDSFPHRRRVWRADAQWAGVEVNP